MRARCPHCAAQIELDDSRNAGRRMAQVKCWMCAQSSVVDLTPPDMNSSTIELSSVPDFDRELGAHRMSRAAGARSGTLDLPEHKSIMISVVEGASQGIERSLTVPLVTIGRLRGGADIEIDDGRVSRLHCAIEVTNDSVLLRDLRSTNGTFLGERRIQSIQLEQSAEFRIGETKIRVVIQPREITPPQQYDPVGARKFAHT
jgi:predicted Zn finger-like uncharacterized protein